MSLRRPSLKSTLFMALLAAGIVLTGVLIFRGAGVPREPARAVAPGESTVHLEAAGGYFILAEQVVVARPQDSAELRTPEVALELTDPSGAPVALRPAGLSGWFFKFFTRQHGYTLAAFAVERPGDFRVRAGPAGEAGARPDRAVVLAFAPAASPGRLLWLVLGFGGQICFSLRFLVQWLASEKAGRSTVPRSFWYYSLVGGLMVLVYAIYTRDPVFILAYAFNAFIYVRNLVLIRREDRAAAGPEPGGGGAAPASPPPGAAG